MFPLLRSTRSVGSGLPPAARLDDAVKIHGRGSRRVRALDRVTIAIEPARLTAVVGPRGSGKTTLLRCLTGEDGLTSGRTHIGDVDLTFLRSRSLRRLRRERVARVDGASRTEAAWVEAIVGSPLSEGDGAAWIAAVRDLACHPKVIVADDVPGPGGLTAFLRRMVDAFGQTVVMTTTDPVSAKVADRVVHLVAGRVTGPADGPPC